MVFLLTSCFQSSVCVGNMKRNQEGVLVAKEHNSHFIYGLVGHNKMKAKDYIENQPDYRIRTYHSFVDGLLQSITFGIYCPTTTEYYVPYDAAGRHSKKRRSYDDDDD